MYECCPVLATFDIRILKMPPEMNQFTQVSETEIVIIIQSKFQTQKSEANQHLIECTEISLLWFWMWREQQFITRTFLHHRRKAYRRRSQRKDTYLTTVNQNINTRHNNMLLNHSGCLVCTQITNLR